jgi:predicted  nucleic acid-binding Zn-ribbon protein
VSVQSLDTHRIVKRLQQAGFSDAQAETVTDVMREAREFDLASLATKADIATLGSDLRSEIATLGSDTKSDIVTLASEIATVRTDFSALRADIASAQATIRSEMTNLATKVEFAAWRGEMISSIAAVRAEIAEAKAQTRSEVSDARSDIVKWVVGLVLVQGGIVVGLLKPILGDGR